MDDSLAGVITFRHGDVLTHTYQVQRDGTVKVTEKEKRRDLLSQLPLGPDYTTDTFSYDMDA